jgi:hypothetical protein
MCSTCYTGSPHGFVYDFLIAGKTAREVDAQEFRAWIIAHGTSPAVAANSFITRALYDTMFQYEEGDLARPSYAAGTSVQVILRLFRNLQRRGAVGDAGRHGRGHRGTSLSSAESRGVAFQFFRDVTKLALDADRTHVAEIHLTRQADLVGAEYQPTFKCGGMDCWPAEPFWDQLKNGSALHAAGVDFESPWSEYQPAGYDVLRARRGFRRRGSRDLARRLQTAERGPDARR